MSDYYIISLNHTAKRDAYICFWRPSNAGYCWPLSWAGRYSEAVIKEHLYYYNNGYCSLAVRCDAIDAISEPPKDGKIDDNAGPVVRNLRRNWKKIMDALIEQPYKDQDKSQQQPAPRR